MGPRSIPGTRLALPEEKKAPWGALGWGDAQRQRL